MSTLNRTQTKGRSDQKAHSQQDEWYQERQGEQKGRREEKLPTTPEVPDQTGILDQQHQRHTQAHQTGQDQGGKGAMDEHLLEEGRVPSGVRGREETEVLSLNNHLGEKTRVSRAAISHHTGPRDRAFSSMVVSGLCFSITFLPGLPVMVSVMFSAVYLSFMIPCVLVVSLSWLATVMDRRWPGRLPARPAGAPVTPMRVGCIADRMAGILERAGSEVVFARVPLMVLAGAMIVTGNMQTGHVVTGQVMTDSVAILLAALVCPLLCTVTDGNRLMATGDLASWERSS